MINWQDRSRVKSWLVSSVSLAILLSAGAVQAGGKQSKKNPKVEEASCTVTFGAPPPEDSEGTRAGLLGDLIEKPGHSSGTCQLLPKEGETLAPTVLIRSVRAVCDVNSGDEVKVKKTFITTQWGMVESKHVFPWEDAPEDQAPPGTAPPAGEMGALGMAGGNGGPAENGGYPVLIYSDGPVNAHVKWKVPLLGFFLQDPNNPPNCTFTITYSRLKVKVPKKQK